MGFQLVDCYSQSSGQPYPDEALFLGMIAVENLSCFAFHWFRQINDNLIEAFIQLVGQFDKQAKLAAKLTMQQAAEVTNSNLKAAGKLLGLFVDEFIAVLIQSFALLTLMSMHDKFV